jgi:hypothetical protein
LIAYANRYFEFANCESPYELRPLLRNLEVQTSADIKTHYTLGATTVTKSEGGSSVKVSTEEGGTEKLEIHVSTNRDARACALVTDFPDQFIAALELEPADLPDIHSLLQVPHTSLKTLLIKKGITGEDSTDNYLEPSVVDPLIEDLQSQRGDSSDASGDDESRIIASSARPASVGSNNIGSTRSSVRPGTTETTLQPYVNPRSSSRPAAPRSTTPEPQSQIRLNECAQISDESPRERPTTPRPTAAGIFSTENRSHNREQLQNFARNADHAMVSTSGGHGVGGSGGGDAFEMNTLRETLEASDPISTPVQINRSPRRQGGLVPNRNEEQMARDFEVGFLGEQFVSPL